MMKRHSNAFGLMMLLNNVIRVQRCVLIGTLKYFDGRWWKIDFLLDRGEPRPVPSAAVGTSEQQW